MIEDIKITFDHLDLRSIIGIENREKYTDWIFKKVLEFERNVALLNDFKDKDDYFALFVKIENRRNEMQENINGFDFSFWIHEYRHNR